MEKVRIRPARGKGREKLVNSRQAAALVRIGAYVYVEEPATQPATAPTPGPIDELDELSYSDLRALAAEEGIQAEGRKKDDYIAALRYNRRDMRAED